MPARLVSEAGLGATPRASGGTSFVEAPRLLGTAETRGHGSMRQTLEVWRGSEW